MPRKKAAGIDKKDPMDGLEIMEFENPQGEKILMPKRKRYFFGAVAKGYQLQLISQSDQKDMHTGQIIKGRNKVARFKEGVYGPVRSLEEAKMVYGCLSFQQGLLWDMDTQAAVSRENNFQALKQAVMGNNEDERRLFEELKEKFSSSVGAQNGKT